MKNNVKKAIAGIAIVSSACAVFAAAKFSARKSISVLSREDGSGTRSAFVELFGIEKKEAGGIKVDYTTDEAGITNSTAVMMANVACDRYAIGYISLGSLNNSVKAVKIDGADACVSNIDNGSYKISRPFNIVVRDGISDAARDFVSFISSREGQSVIAANNYIKVPSTKAFVSNNASGKVVVAGSSSVSPVMEKLVEAYRFHNENVRIELQTSDSTTGIANAMSGTCDIGMASRSLKQTERAGGVYEIAIAIDGIAVIVNKENPVGNLSREQVEKIFTGEYTKWSSVSR